MSGRPRVAVVGATGAAGSTVLRVLEQRGFPLSELLPMASSRSAGATVRFGGQDLLVVEATTDTVRSFDIVFLAAGSDTARALAPAVAASGGVAVDKSSAYRMDPAVPLVVPEVNAHTLEAHHGIVANPNCVATPLAVVMAPLHRAFGLRRLTVATYQAASGAGLRLAEELRAQTRADAAGDEPEHNAYPHVLHGNVVPGGWSMEGDDTEEELKVIAETRRVLELPHLPIGVTTVRVPVETGHSQAIWAEFDAPVPAAQARRLLESAPGVLVIDDPERQRYPTPREAAGRDEVLVGRVRADTGHPGGLSLFLSCDNLRKGAALNAVQVAELALRVRAGEAGAVARH